MTWPVEAAATSPWWVARGTGERSAPVARESSRGSRSTSFLEGDVSRLALWRTPVPRCEHFSGRRRRRFASGGGRDGARGSTYVLLTPKLHLPSRATV